MTGRRILLLIRDGRVKTWSALCREFGLDPGRFGTLQYILRRDLAALKDAGLISFAVKDDRITGEIKISNTWEKVQSALGISLAQIADFDLTFSRKTLPK